MTVAAVSTNVANVAKITVAMFLHIYICIGKSIRLMVPKPDLHGISQQFDEQSMGEKAADAPPPPPSRSHNPHIHDAWHQ